ncbi:lysophospholipid acyltransferase family protein [Algiphilus sp.]|uniref:lysophospholipid acyltransferase family protein n=1 Tax=Algiphilus sp. TaxID=1872431 RepID=UPI003B519E87
MKASLSHAALQCVGSLPQPLIRLLGTVAGWFLWWSGGRPRRDALTHIARCFPDLPEASRRRLVRQSLRAFCTAVIESPAIWFGPERRLRRWLHAPAAAARLRALADQHPGGAIVLCPHIGSWELAGMFCALHGGITSLYKPQPGAVDALILRGRQRLGARLVSSDGGAGVRALLMALRRGERVGILPDQDPPEGAGAFAPLFGIPAHTPTLVHGLARRTQARVLFCYAERVGWRRFRFHIVPAPSAGNSVEALNRAVEKVVLHLPGQYWWSYRRFRRRPEGQPRFYPR